MQVYKIIGGVASSAVIVAIAVVYSTAPRGASASTPPYSLQESIKITGVAGQDFRSHMIRDYLKNDPGLAGFRPQPRPVPTLPELVFRADQQECLAHNIYFEARGESRLGQEAVAWVTLNRVMDPAHPDTICSVVWAPWQFSWTNDGLTDTPAAGEAWTDAQAIAAKVTEIWNPYDDPTEGSVMFHASSVNPDWSKSFSKIVRIDNHIFYNNG